MAKARDNKGSTDQQGLRGKPNAGVICNPLDKVVLLFPVGKIVKADNVGSSAVFLGAGKSLAKEIGAQALFR